MSDDSVAALERIRAIAERAAKSAPPPLREEQRSPSAQTSAPPPPRHWQELAEDREPGEERSTP